MQKIKVEMQSKHDLIIHKKNWMNSYLQNHKAKQDYIYHLMLQREELLFSM